jgi:hypothetical protein
MNKNDKKILMENFLLLGYGLNRTLTGAFFNQKYSLKKNVNMYVHIYSWQVGTQLAENIAENLITGIVNENQAFLR